MISLTVSLFILLVLWWAFRDGFKAALVTTFIQALFFSYGHLYDGIRQIPQIGIVIARNRYMLVVYALVFVAGMWLIVKKVKNPRPISSILNLACVVLFIYPVYQLVHYSIELSGSRNISENLVSSSTQLVPQQDKSLPDVYYIILDMYTRGDALQKDLGFDNSAFLNSLRQMGFYVADCSQSNYRYTEGSLTSALNMNYLTNLATTLNEDQLSEEQIQNLLKHSLVRTELEAIGYKTVAFETTYEWTSFSDADVYLGLSADSLSQEMTPFETMMKDSTVLMALTDLNAKVSTVEKSTTHPFSYHINRERFLLDQLPKIPAISGSKFVFVHVLMPHFPVVFDAQGNILTDPAFFSGYKNAPVDEEHLRTGYTGEIQFINTQMLSIMKTILADSKTPPIIIMQGDHGLRNENRNQILNTYYFPDQNYSNLYQSISPVNSFRMVFNTYYGTSYDLLPDQTYLRDSNVPQDLQPEKCP